MRLRSEGPSSRSVAPPTSDEMVAIVIVLALVVLLGLWSGVQVTGLLTNGHFADASVGDGISAVRRLFADPAQPGTAWLDSNGDPQDLNRYIYWPATVVALLLWLAAAGVIIRLGLTQRVGSAKRERLGVSTNARLAVRRDLRPLIVTGPTEGRLIIGTFDDSLLATENPNAPGASEERSERDGDRSAVAVIGPARSGKTANVIAGVLDWHGPSHSLLST